MGATVQCHVGQKNKQRAELQIIRVPMKSLSDRRLPVPRERPPGIKRIYGWCAPQVAFDDAEDLWIVREFKKMGRGSYILEGIGAVVKRLGAGPQSSAG